MQKKIFFFTGAMGRGGAERVISILSSAYNAKGWDVKIINLLHSNIEYELPKEIEILDFSSKKGIKRGLFGVLKKIRSFVKKEKPTVVVSFMAQICLLTGIALMGVKVPIVASERIDPSQVQRGFIYSKVLNFVYLKSDLLVLQTQRAKNYFNKKIQKKSVIIGNPIQVYADAVVDKKKRIVTAGRLENQKNQKMLISAFAKLKQEYPEYTLTIYGEGPLREKLQSQIDELRLLDSVFLPGNVPDIHEQIKDAELFVLPSDFEGLSNALLEAMMMGLPVISTDCAGSDEVIEDGRNGFLIPVGDEEILIATMRRLLGDKGLRLEIAKNAKISVQKYLKENIIGEWMNAIEGVSKL